MKRVPTLLVASLVFVWVLIFFSYDLQASLFRNTIPQGTEIKDPYLEQLFVPEFPYQSVKVIETKEGKRYVLVKAKGKVTEKMRLDYEKSTLRNRGIIVFRSGSPRTDTLLISEMRLYRVASEKPYVVEYSEVKGDMLERERKVESVVRNEGKYLIVLIDRNFGKVFQRVQLYPEKEVKCPEPPFVGRYPNSISISCTEKNKWISFLYVTKNRTEDIYDYYRERLKVHYRNVGFNYPERSWLFGEFGMRIDSCYVGSCEVALIEKHFDRIKKELPAKPPIPTNGIVFDIIITKVGLKPIIEDFSFIRIDYCTDPEKISRNIERMKKLYPEGVQ